MPVITERLKVLDRVRLQKGAHNSFEEGACVMELAAYIAGRRHTDAPVCVSPVIGAFLRRWNDDLDDQPRQLLKSYAVKALDTRGTAADEEARAWLVTDWMVRQYTPAWLDLANLTGQATALRNLPELNEASAPEAQSAISAALSAASKAALSAASKAASGAALSAASKALQPTVQGVQQSVLKLLDRLIAIGK